MPPRKIRTQLGIPYTEEATSDACQPKKMINDNRMFHGKRFHSQLILENARFNRFLYSRASHVIACIVNLREGLQDPLLFITLCECSAENSA